MKQLLHKLREAIELPENLIQFRIGDNFYELEKTRSGKWILFTVFGKDLNMNVDKLDKLSRQQVELLLKNTYNNIEIY